ncbi:hypothetical protein [Alkalihalobacillus deserti]|uniref:hypothetical protein n=1 Tax=Alkalihalobacillus deserti TaxID=2879466 RepID=UPI001D145109|nr:hypothetical protein [Alkalihalobacillus deserti]
MNEREIQFESSIKVFGTITIPTSSDDKKMAILLVPGSGPLDRSGNGKRKSQTLNYTNS